MEEIKVFYSDFGVVGDGKTNDFYAIKAAHDKANEIGAKVFADGDKTYYIGKTGGESITVKTNTDFCGAHFIIDDRDILPKDSDSRTCLFVIESDFDVAEYREDSDEVRALAAACPFDINTKKLPLSFGFPAMIIPFDAGKKVYIRRGNTPNSGQDQHELIVIDENGNIDESTPALLPYNNVTKLEVYRIDDEPITIQNGIFTTRANAAPREYWYYRRNITVKRSNTTLKNIEHYVTDEGDEGAPYKGFIDANHTNNLLVENCIVSAHKTYWETSGRSKMGTYDLSGNSSNKMYFKNCRQANFFNERGERNYETWGIMGSNYCKNITYDGCFLSRFDAHAGVYNASIINSTVANLRLTGGGKFILRDSTIFGFGNTLISLREDYGCTWRGDIEINNVIYKNTEPETSVFGAEYNPCHNFGYQAYYPENITIEGLTLETPAKLSLFSDIAPGCNFDPEADTVEIDGEIKINVNKTFLPKKIEVKDFPENAYSFYGSPNAKLNSLLKLETNRKA